MRYAISSDKILDISANEDTYTRGESLYREGKLSAFHVRRQRDSTMVKATVKGNYRNFDVSLMFDTDGDLSEYTCTCASHGIWQGACKHAVAVLFAISDGRAVSARSRIRQDQEALADALEKLILQNIDNQFIVPAKSESSRLAKLSPRFHYIGENEARLSFYVGYSRMYTIKSLPKFLQAVEQGSMVRYGNGLEFNHSLSQFTPASRRWIEFLKHEEELFAEIFKHISQHHAYVAREDKREIPLSTRNMDTFFEMCKNSEISASLGLFSDQDEESLLRLTTDNPSINFNILHGQDELILQGAKISYSLLKGRDYFYFLANNTLYRMEKVEAQILCQIQEAINASDSLQITLTNYARRKFISATMPKLKEMGMIEEDLCPALTAKMYFDTDDKDILGRVVFTYGEDKEYDAFDLRESDIPRDIAGEYTVKRMLECQGFLPEAENKLFRLTGTDNIFNFIGDFPAGIDELKSYEKGEIFVSDKLKKKTVKAEEGSLGVRLKGRLLDIYVEDSGFTLEELAEALESYRDKRKYHRLKDGRLLALTDPATASMAETLAALDVERKDIQKGSLYLPVYRAPYVQSIIREQNTAFKKMMRQFRNKEEFTAPKSLKKILRPYQTVGFQWLKSLVASGFGGILADDMGLGKTLQVLALLLSEDISDASALVVAPTSLVFNWAAEIKKFAPELTFSVVIGTPEKRHELLKEKGIQIFITTYDSMKRDEEIHQQQNYKFIIADEAQNIKNPGTKNSKIIKSIPAEYRIALTGTPIENNLTELWSLFDFVMPGYLHSARKFARMYEVPITKENNREKAARLKEQIAPFILRRLKVNVLSELPPKTETTLIAEMLPEQQKIYMAYLMKAKGELKNLVSKGQLKTGRMQILAQLTRLRQICCHPSLCVENYRGGSGKLDLALETLEIAIESGHRCLLFSQFTDMLGILKKALDKKNISYFYLDGGTHATDRIDMVNSFNAGEKDVFLISLKAGGTGLNLTGADIVIHYDPWWNPSVMDQASDRAYRMGQNKAVQVFNLVTMHTLEEGIMELQEKKRKLIDSVLSDSGEGVLQALTDAEIEKLLEAQ